MRVTKTPDLQDLRTNVCETDSYAWSAASISNRPTHGAVVPHKKTKLFIRSVGVGFRYEQNTKLNLIILTLLRLPAVYI